jgi:hypothetical protein
MLIADGGGYYRAPVVQPPPPPPPPPPQQRPVYGPYVTHSPAAPPAQCAIDEMRRRMEELRQQAEAARRAAELARQQAEQARLAAEAAEQRAKQTQDAAQQQEAVRLRQTATHQDLSARKAEAQADLKEAQLREQDCRVKDAEEGRGANRPSQATLAAQDDVKQKQFAASLLEPPPAGQTTPLQGAGTNTDDLMKGAQDAAKPVFDAYANGKEPTPEQLAHMDEAVGKWLQGASHEMRLAGLEAQARGEDPAAAMQRQADLIAERMPKSGPLGHKNVQKQLDGMLDKTLEQVKAESPGKRQVLVEAYDSHVKNDKQLGDATQFATQADQRADQAQAYADSFGDQNNAAAVSARENAKYLRQVADDAQQRVGRLKQEARIDGIDFDIRLQELDVQEKTAQYNLALQGEDVGKVLDLGQQLSQSQDQLTMLTSYREKVASGLEVGDAKSVYDSAKADWDRAAAGQPKPIQVRGGRGGTSTVTPEGYDRAFWATPGTADGKTVHRGEDGKYYMKVGYGRGGTKDVELPPETAKLWEAHERQEAAKVRADKADSAFNLNAEDLMGDPQSGVPGRLDPSLWEGRAKEIGDNLAKANQDVQNAELALRMAGEHGASPEQLKTLRSDLGIKLQAQKIAQAQADTLGLVQEWRAKDREFQLAQQPGSGHTTSLTQQDIDKLRADVRKKLDGLESMPGMLPEEMQKLRDLRGKDDGLLKTADENIAKEWKKAQQTGDYTGYHTALNEKERIQLMTRDHDLQIREAELQGLLTADQRTFGQVSGGDDPQTTLVAPPGDYQKLGDIARDDDGNRTLPDGTIVSDDGKTWTFKDGKQVTQENGKYYVSYEEYVADESGGYAVRGEKKELDPVASRLWDTHADLLKLQADRKGFNDEQKKFFDKFPPPAKAPTLGADGQPQPTLTFTEDLDKRLTGVDKHIDGLNKQLAALPPPGVASGADAQRAKLQGELQLAQSERTAVVAMQKWQSADYTNKDVLGRQQSYRTDHVPVETTGTDDMDELRGDALKARSDWLKLRDEQIVGGKKQHMLETQGLHDLWKKEHAGFTPAQERDSQTWKDLQLATADHDKAQRLQAGGTAISGAKADQEAFVNSHLRPDQYGDNQELYKLFMKDPRVMSQGIINEHYMQYGSQPITMQGRTHLGNEVGFALGWPPSREIGSPAAAQQARLGENLFGTGLTQQQQDMHKAVVDQIIDVGGENARVTVVPVVYALDERGGGIVKTAIFKVEGEGGAVKYVDEQGRRYNDVTDYRANNTLPVDGVNLVMPEDGKFSLDANGNVKLSVLDARTETGWETFRRKSHIDTIVGVVGVAAGVVLTVGSLGTLSVPGAALTVASATLIGASVYGVVTSAQSLQNQSAHGVSINFITNRQARMDWLNLGASALAIPTIGAAGRAAVLASQAGKATSASAKTALEAGAKSWSNVAKPFSVPTMGLGGAAFEEGGRYMMDNWQHMSTAEKWEQGGMMLLNLADMGSGLMIPRIAARGGTQVAGTQQVGTQQGGTQAGSTHLPGTGANATGGSPVVRTSGGGDEGAVLPLDVSPASHVPSGTRPGTAAQAGHPPAGDGSAAPGVQTGPGGGQPGPRAGGPAGPAAPAPRPARAPESNLSDPLATSRPLATERADARGSRSESSRSNGDGDGARSEERASSRPSWVRSAKRRAQQMVAGTAPQAAARERPRALFPEERMSRLQPENEGEHLVTHPVDPDDLLYPPPLYLSESARAPRRLTVGEDGRLLDSNGNPYSTPVHLTDEGTQVSMGYVMDREGNFYPHMASTEAVWEAGHVGPGHEPAGFFNPRMVHASTMAGEPVAMAGTWKVEDGWVVDIDNFSGHYHPTPENFEFARGFMQDRGLDLSYARVRQYSFGELRTHVTEIAPGRSRPVSTEAPGAGSGVRPRETGEAAGTDGMPPAPPQDRADARPEGPAPFTDRGGVFGTAGLLRVGWRRTLGAVDAAFQARFGAHMDGEMPSATGRYNFFFGKRKFFEAARGERLTAPNAREFARQYQAISRRTPGDPDNPYAQVYHRVGLMQSPRRTVETIAHELAHAYQHHRYESIQDPRLSEVLAEGGADIVVRQLLGQPRRNTAYGPEARLMQRTIDALGKDGQKIFLEAFFKGDADAVRALHAELRVQYGRLPAEARAAREADVAAEAPVQERAQAQADGPEGVARSSPEATQLPRAAVPRRGADEVFAVYQADPGAALPGGPKAVRAKRDNTFKSFDEAVRAAADSGGAWVYRIAADPQRLTLTRRGWADASEVAGAVRVDGDGSIPAGRADLFAGDEAALRFDLAQLREASANGHPDSARQNALIEDALWIHRSMPAADGTTRILTRAGRDEGRFSAWTRLSDDQRQAAAARAETVLHELVGPGWRDQVQLQADGGAPANNLRLTDIHLHVGGRANGYGIDNPPGPSLRDMFETSDALPGVEVQGVMVGVVPDATTHSAYYMMTEPGGALTQARLRVDGDELVYDGPTLRWEEGNVHIPSGQRFPRSALEHRPGETNVPLRDGESVTAYVAANRPLDWRGVERSQATMDEVMRLDDGMRERVSVGMVGGQMADPMSVNNLVRELQHAEAVDPTATKLHVVGSGELTGVKESITINHRHQLTAEDLGRPGNPLELQLDFYAKTGGVMVVHFDASQPRYLQLPTGERLLMEGTSGTSNLDALYGLFRSKPEYGNIQIVHAHWGGLSRSAGPSVAHANKIRELLESTPNVMIDTSWDAAGQRIHADPELSRVYSDLVNAFPDRFISGSDLVAKSNIYEGAVQQQHDSGFTRGLDDPQRLYAGNYNEVIARARDNMQQFRRNNTGLFVPVETPQQLRALVLRLEPFDAANRTVPGPDAASLPQPRTQGPDLPPPADPGPTIEHAARAKPPTGRARYAAGVALTGLSAAGVHLLATKTGLPLGDPAITNPVAFVVRGLMIGAKTRLTNRIAAKVDQLGMDPAANKPILDRLERQLVKHGALIGIRKDDRALIQQAITEMRADPTSAAAAAALKQLEGARGKVLSPRTVAGFTDAAVRHGTFAYNLGNASATLSQEGWFQPGDAGYWSTVGFTGANFMLSNNNFNAAVAGMHRAGTAVSAKIVQVGQAAGMSTFSLSSVAWAINDFEPSVAGVTKSALDLTFGAASALQARNDFRALQGKPPADYGKLPHPLSILAGSLVAREGFDINNYF